MKWLFFEVRPKEAVRGKTDTSIETVVQSKEDYRLEAHQPYVGVVRVRLCERATVGERQLCREMSPNQRRLGHPVF
jgi:hypothetical protein